MLSDRWMREPVEIMAPAGSWEAVTAALANGAGSVYFGVGRLNMRSRAALNFSPEDLPELAQRCHGAGARAYLTANIVVYDSELDELRELFLCALDAGVDAVIVSDPAAILLARELGLKVHVSTQANVSNFRSLRFFAAYADVIVLARELSLEQIRALSNGIRSEGLRGPSGEPVRLEAFVHGALCVAVSGRCQISLARYDRSANRGECFQSCRRSYNVEDASGVGGFMVEDGHILSPKDLCTIACLDQLIASGVSVLKIEGRGRSPDYVAETVRCYSEAADAIASGTYTAERVAEWRSRLNSVFNRGFWEGGYYLGLPAEMWSGSSGNHSVVSKRQIGVVSNFFVQAGVVEFDLCGGELAEGDMVMVYGTTTAPVQWAASGMRKGGIEVDRPVRGEGVTLQAPARLRRGDKVFVLVKSDFVAACS